MTIIPSLEEITEQSSDMSDISSRTYRLNFESGELDGVITGSEAIRQAVHKALATPRFRYLIYDDAYGSELESCIGQDLSREYMESELPRMVEEALLVDDRIYAVSDIQFSFQNHQLYVELQLDTAAGEITEEVLV